MAQYGDWTDKIARQVLEPGEKLLWSGRPVRIWLLTKSFPLLVRCVVILVIFGFGSLALFTSVALAGKRTVPLVSFALPGIAIAMIPMAYLFARVLGASKCNIVYAITNVRVVLVRYSGIDVKVEREWGRTPLLELLVHKYPFKFGHLQFGVRHTEPNEREPRIDGLLYLRNPSLIADVIVEQRYAPGADTTWLSQEVSAESCEDASIGLMIDSNLSKLAAGILLPGERLKWVGRPDSRLYAQHKLASSIAVTILFSGAFWVAALIRTRTYEVAGLVERNLMVDAGLWVSGAAPLVALFAARVQRTMQGKWVVYLVTNVRAVVYKTSVAGKRRVQSFSVPEVETVSVTQRAEAGDVTMLNTGVRRVFLGYESGLIGVSEPKRVARLIREQPWAKGIEFKGLD